MTERQPGALYDAATTRVVEAEGTARAGISTYDLMERAGRAVFECLRERWPHARRLAIVCGPGNNGGDGYVVARVAREAGCAPTVYAVEPQAAVRGDAARARAALAASVTAVDAAALTHADVIVDGVLGTGLTRAVDGAHAQVIAAINQAARPVLAIDVPSGLDANTGAVMGQAVSAQVTLSLVTMKQGLMTGDARDYCGDIVHAPLGIDARSIATPTAQSTSYSVLRQRFARRARSAHKGHHGHVLVIGGAPGYAGAARLAAEAALRVGAGLVSVATHPAHAAVIAAQRPELMCHGVDESRALAALFARADVLAVGPGLSQTMWASRLWPLLRECRLPAVFDADALNWLAADPEHCEQRVLTPHPGEAARLAGVPIAVIQGDRLAAARSLRARYGGTLVLKGAGSVIAAATGAPWIVTDGNPGMASAGMGDVLTGVIAGLVAQGHSLPDAAVLGTCVHACAGDRAAVGGERGLLAGDLLPFLRELVNPPA